METLLLALVIAAPAPALAGVDVNVHIALPPPIVFVAPPELIVIPDTYVYVAPEVDEDIFFWNGWWWRLWEGRWYRSNYYNRGWVYYNNVPRFYFDVDPGWRGYYRDNNCTGTAGTMSGFLTSDCKRIGRAGKITGTGKGKEHGASRAISPARSNSDRN